MPWHRTCASHARPCTLGNCRPVQGVSLISQAVFLDSQPRGPTIAPLYRAGIAQLVERNLAKVEVASSSLVSRSKIPLCFHRVSCVYESFDAIYGWGSHMAGIHPNPQDPRRLAAKSMDAYPRRVVTCSMTSRAN